MTEVLAYVLERHPAWVGRAAALLHALGAAQLGDVALRDILLRLLGEGVAAADDLLGYLAVHDQALLSQASAVAGEFAALVVSDGELRRLVGRLRAGQEQSS